MKNTFSKKNLHLVAFIFLGLLISVTQISCNKDSATGNSTMRVHLTDAPGDYQAVYVDIQAVEITGVNGDVTINLIRPGIYNLLDFRNGLDTLLGSASLPAGRVSQIRLVLGSNNSIMVDGNVYALSTPSAQQSGLKLNLNSDLEAGVVYDIWLDFDASRSIVKHGNGDYSLKPVIRAFSKPITGAITGIVTPVGSVSTMVAIQNNDTIGTIVSGINGSFYLNGVKPGTYRLLFKANLGFIDAEITGITVSSGLETNVGTVIIL